MPASAYTVLKRGALYVLPEVTPGTYVAPTQGSDLAVRCTEVKVAIRGGQTEQVEDVQPFGGGTTPILGPIGTSFAVKMKLPKWPDLSSPLGTELPISNLFQACPMVQTESATQVLLAPVTAFVPGTSIIPVSITYIEVTGNVYSGTGGIARLVGVHAPKGQPYVEVEFEIHCMARSTLTDTVVSLATASLTIGAVVYPTTETPIVSKGATITLTGLSGSGTFSLDASDFDPGQTLQEQESQNEAQGYGLSLAHHTGYGRLKCSVSALTEGSGAGQRLFWGAMLAETAITASIQYGTSDFKVALAAGRCMNHTMAEGDGKATLDLDIVGIPSGTGNNQYSLAWGAP